MKLKPRARPPSAEDLIASVTATSWAPPPELIPGLSKLLKHNQDNPTRRIGIRRLKRWLADHDVHVGREALGRWIRERGDA